jgi:hypothetical protein
VPGPSVQSLVELVRKYGLAAINLVGIMNAVLTVLIRQNWCRKSRAKDQEVQCVMKNMGLVKTLSTELRAPKPYSSFNTTVVNGT